MAAFFNLTVHQPTGIIPQGARFHKSLTVQNPVPGNFGEGIIHPFFVQEAKRSSSVAAAAATGSSTNSHLTLPTLTNDSFAQLPILWTALSLALGVEVQGEILRGLPCIKRLNQLFCRTRGTSYPTDKIERFIDDNKALMRRMYGQFLTNINLGDVDAIRSRLGRSVDEEDQLIGLANDFEYHSDDPRGETFFSSVRSLARSKRQSTPGPTPNSNRLDACESKEEVSSPYWASNAAGKIRAIVNTNEFSQIIHQEVCTKTTTKRCGGECGCEQKYKWHRLLSYDPENDCRGIFMDWYLFPSCCVCRCDPF